MIVLLFAFYLSHTGAGVEPSVAGDAGVKTGPIYDVVIYGATPAGIAAALAAADAGAARVALLEPTYQIGKISFSYKGLWMGDCRPSVNTGHSCMVCRACNCICRS